MLRYSIADEMLYSTDKGFSFSTKAYSGGGRGSTKGMQKTDVAHWSATKKAPDAFDADNRGGPLPTGFYVAKYIGKHKKFGECVRLEQTLTSLVHVDILEGIKVTKRDGFLIHGEGPRGSDGCIVPSTKEALKALLSYIKTSKSTVLLKVHSEGIRSDKTEGRRSMGNVA